MRVPQFLKNMAASILDVLAGIITKPRVVREAEFLVDLSICMALAVIPGKPGWLFCIAFFLLRDAIDNKRHSPGKILYKLRIVYSTTGTEVGWRTTIVRNIILLAPLLNIVEIAHFLKTGRRLTDEWLGIDVLQDAGKNEDAETQQEEDNPNPPTAD